MQRERVYCPFPTEIWHPQAAFICGYRKFAGAIICGFFSNGSLPGKKGWKGPFKPFFFKKADSVAVLGGGSFKKKAIAEENMDWMQSKMRPSARNLVTLETQEKDDGSHLY